MHRASDHDRPLCGQREVPFIHLTFRDGRTDVTGAHQWSTGHRIPRAGSPGDGVFASWAWHDGTLTVSNDRYGFSPLFYAVSPAAIVVSPSIAGILQRGVSTELDDTAVALFLRLNFFVGDDTPFAAIRAVPPAAGFTWRAGRLEVSHRPMLTAHAFNLDRRGLMYELIGGVRRSVERRQPDSDVVLPLSGGKDSRHILFALLHTGVQPRACVTVRHYPPRGNEDVAIAVQVAHRAGVPHVVLDTLSRRIDAERRKNRLTHFCSDEHVQFLPIHDYLRRNPSAIYDGIAGDMLTQSWRIPPAMRRAFKDGDVAAASTELLAYEAPGLEQGLQSLLSLAARRRFGRDRAEERLRAEVARHMDRPNPEASFYLWNRTRREVALAPFAMFGFLPQVFAPFLDADLFDLLASVPVELIDDTRLHADALRAAYPQFADIPFESPSAGRRQPGYARGVSTALLRLIGRGSPFIECGYVVPRLAAAWMRDRVEPIWFVPLIVWLHQIERLAAGQPEA